MANFKNLLYTVSLKRWRTPLLVAALLGALAFVPIQNLGPPENWSPDLSGIKEIRSTGDATREPGRIHATRFHTLASDDPQMVQRIEKVLLENGWQVEAREPHKVEFSKETPSRSDLRLSARLSNEPFTEADSYNIRCTINASWPMKIPMWRLLYDSFGS